MSLQRCERNILSEVEKESKRRPFAKHPRSHQMALKDYVKKNIQIHQVIRKTNISRTTFHFQSSKERNWYKEIWMNGQWLTHLNFNSAMLLCRLLWTIIWLGEFYIQQSERFSFLILNYEIWDESTQFKILRSNIQKSKIWKYKNNTLLYVNLAN